jgi:hypothetical protein
MLWETIWSPLPTKRGGTGIEPDTEKDDGALPNVRLFSCTSLAHALSAQNCEHMAGSRVMARMFGSGS